MKQYAIFSDVHGNYEALEAIMEDLKKENYDDIFYLGDAISIGPDSKKCLELLKNSNIKFILGNHELYYLYDPTIDGEKNESEVEHLNWVKTLLDESDLDYLKKCPLYYKITIEYEHMSNKEILLSHFLFNDETKTYPFEENQLKKDLKQWIKYNDTYAHVIIGHEHEIKTEDECEALKGRCFDEVMDCISNLWIVGSAGCTKDNQTTYTTLRIGKTRSLKRVTIPYDREKFLKRINENDYPDKENIMKYFYGI